MQYDLIKHRNTIDPLIESGHLLAAARGEYMYPRKIIFYPGINCMFDCLFCGRDRNTFVKKSLRVYDVYKQVIDQDNGEYKDRFDVTGGLEPLTNPYLNDICKDLLDGGYEARMLTNGFMLTQKYLSNNPWINSLKTIRVSLYGLDEQETIATSQNRRAWRIVKDNLTEYNKSSEKTKLGLNYVLLPDHYEKLDLILDYISDIGGVDYLSLREDFTFKYTILDRDKLKVVLQSFDRRAKDMGIQVDYGYALHEILHTDNLPTLTRCELEHLTPKQSPQVKVFLNPDGNIFCWTDAAFVGRKEGERHILGNVIGSSIEDQLRKQVEIEPKEEDLIFLDAFNHIVEYYKWKIQ